MLRHCTALASAFLFGGSGVKESDMVIAGNLQKIFPGMDVSPQAVQ